MRRVRGMLRVWPLCSSHARALANARMRIPHTHTLHTFNTRTGARWRRLATADYLASLLEGTCEINRVGKGLLPEDMADIASYVKSHPKVERMFLSGNSLGISGAKQLCALLADASLRLVRLDLRHNSLGNDGCTALVESLAANKTLTRIDLSANGITSVAASSIAVMLSKNESLVRLDLRHNDLGDTGAATLASAVKGRCFLQHLDLSANSIGHKGAEALAAALKVNTLLQVRAGRGAVLYAREERERERFKVWFR
jgi:hypothetical protein